jgi:hypothetical protein
MAARGAPRTTKKTAFIRAHKSTPKKTINKEAVMARRGIHHRQLRRSL